MPDRQRRPLRVLRGDAPGDRRDLVGMHRPGRYAVARSAAAYPARRPYTAPAVSPEPPG